MYATCPRPTLPSNFVMLHSVPTKGVGYAGTNHRGRRPERGHGPTMLQVIFVFLGSIITCGLYQLTLSGQS